MILLYLKTFGIFFLNRIPFCINTKLIFLSVGVSIDLHPSIHVLFNRLRTYFLGKTKIPFFDISTSIPRKYLKDTEHSMNSLSKGLHILASFLVSIMSLINHENGNFFVRCLLDGKIMVNGLEGIQT